MDVFTPNWLIISSLISNLSIPILSAYPLPDDSRHDFCYVTRAAYDIGSDGTKYMLAQVNVCQGSIEHILMQDKIPVAYRHDLYRSSEQKFSAHIREKGTRALHDAKSAMESSAPHIAQHCAVATASFRAARNADDFVRDLSINSNISVKTLSQKDEGILAYLSVLSKTFDPDPASMVVWDIGGGSMQLTFRDSRGEWHVLGSELASSSFLNVVLKDILGKSIEDSPYPMSHFHIQDAIALAEKQIVFHKEYVEKYPASANIVAIGAVHNAVIQPLCQRVSPEHEHYYTRGDLEKVMALLAERSHDELQELLNLSDPNLLKNQLTNVILAYAVMKKLSLQTISTLQASNVEGLLIRGC